MGWRLQNGKGYVWGVGGEIGTHNELCCLSFLLEKATPGYDFWRGGVGVGGGIGCGVGFLCGYYMIILPYH